LTPALHLYLDDSGSRDLDKTQTQTGSRWFALGGLLIKEEDEAIARLAHADFCKSWNIAKPLHSYEIRNRTANFEWLQKLSEHEHKRFMNDLTEMLVNLPVLGTACVVDRQGYNDRYREKYGLRRWAVCKTAFSIVVERAAKYACRKERRLKVFYERTDKLSEARLEQYFADLRAIGMPFNSSSSAQYAPMASNQMKDTLWECRKKFKSSPIMQLADLYLWPICKGGYEHDYKPLLALRAHHKTINCVLPAHEHNVMGIKYSCFEPEKQKGKDESFP
jgi:hypothetical protein